MIYNNHMKIRFCFFLVFFLMISSFAAAGPTAFRAEVDRDRVVLGDAVVLNLVFEGEQNVPAPELPAMDGFQTQYLGPTSQFSMVNGRTNMSVTHRYLLVPQKQGHFEIGPFSVEYEGKTYTSGLLTILVEDAPAPQATNAVQGQEPFQLSQASLEKRIFLRLEVQKTDVFQNELIPVSIKLYSDRLPLRVEKLPELTALTGFSVLDFGQPRQYKEVKDNTSFDVLEFPTHVYASRTGELSLGPARMTPIIVLRKSAANTSGDPFAGDFFNSIFSGWEEPYPVNLASEPVTVNVKPLPEQGRPAVFNGAVGTFHLQVMAEPRKVREGDPVTINMAVRGEGNFNSVQVPKLEGTEGFKVYDPKILSSTEQEKVFEQVILPVSADIRMTPSPVFSFFDPKAQSYQTLTPGAFPLEVEKQEGASSAVKSEPAFAHMKEKEEERPSVQDIVFIKESPQPCAASRNPYEHFSFWLIQLIPLTGFVTGCFYQRYRKRMTSDSGFARRLRAPGKARQGLLLAGELLKKGQNFEFYDIVHKTLREYLGDRFHVPATGWTALTADQFLEEKMIPADMRGKIIRLFEECDAVRFAKRNPKTADLEQTLKYLAEIIDRMEKGKV